MWYIYFLGRFLLFSDFITLVFSSTFKSCYIAAGKASMGLSYDKIRTESSMPIAACQIFQLRDHLLITYMSC